MRFYGWVVGLFLLAGGAALYFAPTHMAVTAASMFANPGIRACWAIPEMGIGAAMVLCLGQCYATRKTQIVVAIVANALLFGIMAAVTFITIVFLNDFGRALLWWAVLAYSFHAFWREVLVPIEISKAREQLAEIIHAEVPRDDQHE